MNFLNYLLKAKGRHGTHSPYIYKFVEDALHENAHPWDYPGEIGGSAKNRRKERALFRVLSYLIEAQQLVVTPEVIQIHDWLKHFKPVITAPDQLAGIQQAVYVLSIEEMERYKRSLSVKGMSSGSTFLLLHPGNHHYTLLEAYFNSNWFNATIFTWDFSILMQRADFKRKQHFVLR